MKYAVGCYVEWWETIQRKNTNLGLKVLVALGASLVREFKRFRAAETAVAAAFAVMVTTAGSVPAEAEQRAPPRIDSFGPYKVGMPLADAKKADPNAKEGACGDLAEDRQCLIVKAAVFEEPAVIYAVLDEKRERVDKVIAKLDPKLSRRRAYRCIRLSEKVFALLVVVYGSKYKQQYDANKRPLPAVAWDGELEGRLIFRANCRTQDEGTPLITVLPRKGEGSSVAADLSPTTTPKKGGKSAAELLQGQKPGNPGTARADAVSALAEQAKKAEQQVRRAAPVIQEPPAEQSEPTDPIILGAGPGGLSIDGAPIAPKPAPTAAEIGIDDPSMLPRAAPRTPVSSSLLPDATPPVSTPSPEPAVPQQPAPPPAVVAAKPATSNAPAVAPPANSEPAPSAKSAQAAVPAVDQAQKPAPTSDPVTPPQSPAVVARVSPNAPSSRSTPGPSATPAPGAVAGIEPNADRSVYVDADDDEGEQAEPIREMPVFAQTGTKTSPASPVEQASRTGAVQAPAALTPPPTRSVTAEPAPIETPAPPPDSASQVASAAIPKSPKAVPPATGRPRSLIAARDTARPAADPTPRTYPAEKANPAIPVVKAVTPKESSPSQQPAGTAGNLPDLDDEPTGTVAVSADRAPERPVAPSSERATAGTAAPNVLDQRIASGEPRRLIRDTTALPDRARPDTPPSSPGRVTATPLPPVPSIPSATPVQPAPGASGQSRTPVTGGPANTNPVQTATVPNRRVTPQRPSPDVPVSRMTPDGVEDFGYDLDLRIERQKSRWKAPVPPVRPWRTLGTSSLTDSAVRAGVADTMVLDEPSLAVVPSEAETQVTATGAASVGANVGIGLAVREKPKAMNVKTIGIEPAAPAVPHTPGGTDSDLGASVLDEPGFAADGIDDGEPSIKKVRPPVPPDAPTGTAALDEPLVSDVTGAPDPAPESADVLNVTRHPADANLQEKSAPVPPKRPWDTLADEIIAIYVTPAPVPAARPQAESRSEPRQDPQEKLAEQGDGSILDIGSSVPRAPDVDSNSFGRRTDILDHL